MLLCLRTSDLWLLVARGWICNSYRIQNLHSINIVPRPSHSSVSDYKHKWENLGDINVMERWPNIFIMTDFYI